MNTADALLTTLVQQRGKPRGDELKTHVADLTGCLRATAYRRRGVAPAPLTAQELAKFAIGLGYEAEVAQTLTDAGHIVVEGLEVEAFGLDVGHPDLFVDGQLLIETKTTSGGAYEPQTINRKPNPRAGERKDVSVHHAIQASTYALALGASRAIVLVNHLGYKHDEIAHEINPEDYREIIEARAREVVALTGPEMPLPPAEPPPLDVVPYDACGYCRYRMCDRNPQHDPSLLEMELA